MMWGPDSTFGMVKAALDMQASWALLCCGLRPGMYYLVWECA